MGSWPGGWQGEVTVTAGSAPVDGWSVGVPLPAGASVTQLWGGVRTSTPDGVVVTPAAWNGTLAAGGAATFGFIGTGAAPSGTGVTCVGS
ncbi:Exoglucanase/xylanase precursor [compost metagenome]